MIVHPLRALLAELRRAGVSFDLVDGELVFEPPLGASGRRRVSEFRVPLELIVTGRRDGHAIAFCRCGEWSMLSIVNSSGTSRWAPSSGWPRCPFCGRTGTRTIDLEDREGVARVRPPGVPTMKRWLEARVSVADAINALELDG